MTPDLDARELHNVTCCPVPGREVREKSTGQGDGELAESFSSLFQGMIGSSVGNQEGEESAAERERRRMIARQDTADETSAGCQSNGGDHGGFDNPDGQASRSLAVNRQGRAEESDSIGSAGSLGGDREKRNKNYELATQGADVGARGKGPVHGNFEQAGLPRHELSRLVRVLHNSSVAGQSHISVAVRTEELGEIAFHVRIEEKRVYIHAFVGTEKAAGALALAISELRDKLAEVGLMLARLDVTTGQDHAERKRSGSRKMDRQPRDDGTERAGAGNRPLPSRGKNADGVLHVLA